jgi:hypothetical protein
MRQVFHRLCLVLTAAASLVGCGSDEPKGQAWIGRTFLLDTPAVSNSRWKKPPAAGQVLINYAPQFLLAVADGAGNDLAVTIATAQEYVQDPCTPTVQTTTRRSDDPHSTISLSAFPMHIVSRDPARPGQSQVTIHDVVFTDVLPGLSSAATARLLFTVNLATLCPAMAEAGIPCEVCPWDGEPLCQTVELIEVTTQEVPLPIVPVSASELPAACL